MKACIVVPHYDHVEQFRCFLPLLAATDLPLVVVDDASPEAAFAQLEDLLRGSSVPSTLLRHEVNEGKGSAVLTGLRAARDAGFTHGLQIDADGQHDCDHITEFLAAAEAHPHSFVCGAPVFDASRSTLRYYARYITLAFTWLETLSTEIRDAMCGFRLYPLESAIAIFERAPVGKRMAFDPEILVRAVWAGIRLEYVPVKVIYPEDGRSHFRYVRDNLEISWMHTRLLIGMVLRLPTLIGRKFAGSGLRA